MMDENYFLFWDKCRDELEILCEDGEFYFYSEDSVAIDQGLASGRKWTRLEKLRDITPLNSDWAAFQILDWGSGEWVDFGDARLELIQAAQKQAGIVDWKDVF
jgi:hypothetical protein